MADRGFVGVVASVAMTKQDRGRGSRCGCRSRVRGEAGRTNEIEGELLANGGGEGGDDLFDGGFGEDIDVTACCGLLEEGARLAKGIIGAEVSLDLSEGLVWIESMTLKNIGLLIIGYGWDDPGLNGDS
ncbi:hypothetical protein RIF29_20765 [Crotalaria pallida]|uniref:Uncharacterized protein n=1 Tax=Crotalaria pallida TaxID=3830 RepID=A0AAN9F1T4_CROPI